MMTSVDIHGKCDNIRARDCIDIGYLNALYESNCSTTGRPKS